MGAARPGRSVSVTKERGLLTIRYRSLRQVRSGCARVATVAACSTMDAGKSTRVALAGHQIDARGICGSSPAISSGRHSAPFFSAPSGVVPYV
jgi:hypothetical protein